MTFEERIAKELIGAMRAKDQGALRALRAIKAEILLYKTSGTDAPLDELVETRMLQKMVKQRKESLSIFEEQSREDLAHKEREEIAIIESFLPKQLDEPALKTVVSALISELGATGMKDMGKVMAEANGRLAGQADGKSIATLVKAMLSGA
jgi:uncharacterized protein YqeY